MGIWLNWPEKNAAWLKKKKKKKNPYMYVSFKENWFLSKQIN